MYQIPVGDRRHRRMSSTIKQQQLKGSSGGGAKKSKSLSIRKRTPVKIRAEDIFASEKPPASPQTSLENNKPLTIDVEDVEDRPKEEKDETNKKEKDESVKKDVPKDTKVNFGAVKIEEPVVKVKNLDEVRVSQVTADNIDSAEELISQALSDWRKHKSSTSSPSVNPSWKKSRSTTSAQVFSILKSDKGEVKDDSAVGKEKLENLGELKKKKRSSMLVDKNELINEEKGDEGDKENDENQEEHEDDENDDKKRRKRTFSLRFSGKGRIELKAKLEAQGEGEKDKSPSKKRNKETSEVIFLSFLSFRLPSPFPTPPYLPFISCFILRRSKKLLRYQNYIPSPYLLILCFLISTDLFIHL